MTKKGSVKTESSPEKWPTPRRCERCLLRNKGTNYLEAQNWGRLDDGRMEYMLSCKVCSWTGKSLWDGQSGFRGRDLNKKGNAE